MKAQLQKGGDIVITSNLLKAIPEQIAEIAELRCSDLKALVNDFGSLGKSGRDLLIPQVRYQTNDAWELASAGRPLKGGVSGYPMLLRALYSKGSLYVITIPDDMGNLYDLPEGVLNIFRRVMSQDLPVRIEAPSKVSLFLYDNGTFIVESFNDEPVTIRVITDEGVKQLTDIVDDSVVVPVSEETSSKRFRLTLMPHSYRVFKY